MKTLILQTFLLLVSVVSFAQNFSVGALDTTFYGYSTDVDFGGSISLKNNTLQTLSMKWIRIENTLPSNWESSVCDPNACYLTTKDSAAFSLPKVGFNNIINVHFYPNNTEGTGTTKVKVFQTSNRNAYVVLNFTGVAQGPSTSMEVEQEGFMVYPTQTKDLVNVINITNEEIGIEIFDMTGRSAKKQVILSSETIDISSFSAGIYFLKLNSKRNGEQVVKILKV